MEEQLFKQNIEVVQRIHETIGHLKPVRKDGVFLVHDEMPNEVVTDSGLIVLQRTTRNLKYRQGTVISVGESVHSVKPMDHVVLYSFMGKEVDLGYDLDAKVLLVSEDQIDGIIE